MQASITWDEALERVGQLVAVALEGDLERLRIEEPGFALELRRRVHACASPPTHAAAAAAQELGTAATLHALADGAVAPRELFVLKADFVGIVRFSRPVVSEGSVVHEDRELAYVESLGTRNPIRAARRGRISAVYVVDGQPVDYGHPLFEIEYE